MPTIRNSRRAGFVILFAAALAQAGTIGSPVSAGGYVFTNFDFPNAGNAAGAGSNANGISNAGAAVGFSFSNNGIFSNFIRNPNGTFSALNLVNPTDMAFGINTAGDVVGQENNVAFFLPPGGSPQTLLTPSIMSTAFGINDDGNIVGQFSQGANMPGFFLSSSVANALVQILAPAGSNMVNAQGINDNGLIVGFYVGNDGQDHGFQANLKNATGGILPGSAIADPSIPSVAGEPGATFVFSQILGINDSGIAAGYYGDSTTSQHGFLYNTNTGAFTFLDDPAEQFSSAGVEVTQITGINNAGEISGFYSDANGVFHGFVATNAAAPEPGSWFLGGLGLATLAVCRFRRRPAMAAV
jgi:PEP-CTERM motif